MVEARYDIAHRLYPYRRVSDQDRAPVRHPVVVVGGGPVGLVTALDLCRRGTPVLLLDDHEGAGKGSRAICFSKRTLEISDRLGFAEKLLGKGVQWSVGRVFHGGERVFEFNLQSEPGHRFPAFVNLQQPYFEKFAVEEIRKAQADGAPVEIRGCNRVTGLKRHQDHVTIDIDTPDGPYQIEADWLIACDGARSSIREMMGLSFEGRVFRDNFLIADIKMEADFPTERWFWFEPPFENAGQSALLHKQPDNIWRIDFQLGWDIDRDSELDPLRIRRRVDAMLEAQTGRKIDYELEWASIYTFQCRRINEFRHGPVIFAGDAAHQVSPFGARGANSGVQDADNLGWKLDLVVKGLAPQSLMDSYGEERVHGADENISNSTRATDFLTPKSRISRLFRDAVLKLAQKHRFARPLVNSGRLSVPCVYDGLPLNGPDKLDGPRCSRVGAPCPDAPCPDISGGEGYLLQRLKDGFTILAIDADCPPHVTHDGVTATTLRLSSSGRSAELLRQRYLGNAKTAVYLIRPDQHVAARWPAYDDAQMHAALGRALGRSQACR